MRENTKIDIGFLFRIHIFSTNINSNRIGYEEFYFLFFHLFYSNAPIYFLKRDLIIASAKLVTGIPEVFTFFLLKKATAITYNLTYKSGLCF